MSEATKDKFYNFLTTLKPSRESRGMYVRLVFLAGLLFVQKKYGSFFEDFPYIPVIFDLVVICLSMHVSFYVVSSFIIFVYRKKNRRTDKHVDNFIIGIRKLSRSIFLVLFTLYFIDTALIDLQELLASLAIGTFLIGLVFKDYLLNFFNGVDIMFSGKIRLGEYVKIANDKGKVKDLTFSHVELLTDTKDIVYVPNNFVKTKHVVNYSRSKTKNIFVGLTLDKDRLEYYKELHRYVVRKVLKEFPDIIESKENIKIHMRDMEKGSVTWDIEYIISKYSFETETKLKNFTGEIILDFFNRKDKLKKKEEKQEEQDTKKKEAEKEEDE